MLVIYTIGQDIHNWPADKNQWDNIIQFPAQSQALWMQGKQRAFTASSPPDAKQQGRGKPTRRPLLRQGGESHKSPQILLIP